MQTIYPSTLFIYKINSMDDRGMNLKARIVLNGNKDAVEGDLKKDCTNEDMEVVRILIRIAACMKMDLASADIKGEFMKSGLIHRGYM